MFCTKCSSRIPDGSVFCPECGQKLAADQPAAPSPVRQPPRPAPVRYQAPVPIAANAGDPLTAPLSTASFFWMPVVAAIPVIGFIVLLVWAFSKNTNLNRRHYARAVLIWALISVILTFVITAAGGGVLGSLQGLFGSL